MRQRYVQVNGELVPADEQTARLHYVIDDIPAFVANTGAHIEGKRQWREHLKERGCEELGHADVKARGESWQKRKDAFASKKAAIAKYAPPVEVRESEFEQPMQRSRLHAEVLNRLEGKPAPDRKTLLKLTLDLARNPRYGSR